MKRIAVICAMEKEFLLIKEALGDGCGGIIPSLSGIGKVNAALAASAVIHRSSPDYVISTGVAGTFHRGMEPGDIVIASETAYHDVWCGKGNLPGQVQGCPATFKADPFLLEKAVQAAPDARVGMIITGDQFYIGREEDERQKSLFPEALAVDMESAAVAQTCWLENVPFISIRAVSDVHDGRQAERYSGFWDSLADRTFRTVMAIISSVKDYCG